MAPRVESDDHLRGMEGWGRIAGSVRLSEGFPPSRLGLSAYPDGGGSWARAGGKGWVDEEGAFEIFLRADRTWRLRIEASCGHDIYESAPIDVAAGETISPSYLQRIDLAGLLWWSELKVLSADLRPAAGVQVEPRFKGVRVQGVTASSEEERGQFRVPGCWRAHEIRLSKRGHRPQDMTLVPGRQEAILVDGYRVQLVLDDEVHHPGPGWILGATPFKGKVSIPGRRLPISPSDPIELRVPTEGVHRIEWSLQSPGESVPKVLDHVEGATRVIRVRATQELQVFTLFMPSDELQAWTKDLRSRK